MRFWNIKPLKNRVRAFRWPLIILCVGALVQSLLSVGMAVLTSYVVDAGLTQSPRFLQLGIGLLTVLVSMVLLKAFLSWQAGISADRMAAQLRQDLLRSAEQAGGNLLQGSHSGMLLNRSMEDVHTICAGLTGTIHNICGQLSRLAASFGAVLMLYRPVAGFLMVAAALVGAGAACLRPVIKRRQREVRQSEEEAMIHFQESVGRLELIQALGVEEEDQRRFSVRMEQSLKAKHRRRMVSIGGHSLLSMTSQLGTGGLLLWGIYQVSQGKLSYGSLTAMLQLLSLFRGPAIGLSSIWTHLATIDVAGERLNELMLDDPVPSGLPMKVQPELLAVVFEDVTFTYPGDEAPALAHYTTRIPLRDWTCLTGVSGRGKTTIFRLIMGLYQPEEGRVYVETDRGSFPCGDETRSWFAYVPQDYALFSGNIRDNLLLVAPEADKARRKWALDIAQAGFVEELSAGEETTVGENNAGLSRGQLQRLAIARAVLMERPVLLLDECTSALDECTERAVLQALHQLGGVAILVTHRPNALDGLSRLLMMTMEDES